MNNEYSVWDFLDLGLLQFGIKIFGKRGVHKDTKLEELGGKIFEKDGILYNCTCLFAFRQREKVKRVLCLSHRIEKRSLKRNFTSSFPLTWLMAAHCMLDPMVADFMKVLCSQKIYRYALMEMGMDAPDLPMGMLSDEANHCSTCT
ncbi:hypothetical protein POM88_030507 [Heracleum sosnowskyi]|uniref:PARP alpha-helical domain-containing protein n=1 Tax=Heracleum sosnowskyi TaxID=360622 RepID=A0AAD8MIT6_9APIA|nr:hypothetical protein POM88_030507 [Heracleum sosnowskyi]